MQNNEITISMDEYRYLLECKAIRENADCHMDFYKDLVVQVTHEALCKEGGAVNAE